METGTELVQELQSLRERLQQARGKLQFWMKDEMDQLLQARTTHHQSVLKTLQIEKLDNEKYNAEVKQLSQTVENLRNELEELYTVTHGMSEKAVKTEEEVEVLKQNISDLKNEIEIPTKAKQKLEYLENGSKVFGEALGLEYRKTKGNRIQVIFTQIDEKNPKTPFYFFMRLEGPSRKYVVSDVEPPVEGLQELTQELIQTNNLRKFMIQVRRKFQALVKAQ
ncbi:kinetochore protein Spc25-like [Dreissena polymorpha]|uniref:Kinetochore protein SPC25 n=1 Tax=Dreissena polymorpha TaxID=45954 RepID=A0A9D3YF63_DREPO|nr:kinetochore protein Spc25-like [Dreissena polymorpha]KAH3698712.1 hypothetical protein DPMN_086259 [Dreissena polymorpha]